VLVLPLFTLFYLLLSPINGLLVKLMLKMNFFMAFLLKKFTCDNPPGFTNPRFPSLMYHLKKAIYHLKQAPSAWFHRFSIFFLTHGSSCSQSDSYMFTFGHTSHILILLLYVDDIIQTDNSISRLFSFISTPSQQFAMKELGDLRSILRVQLIRSLFRVVFISTQIHI